jgi:large subunit ribosomal protein L17
MVRNLVASLFEHGRVVTTPAKAKEARPFAEKLITMAKSGSLADRRRAIAKLHDKKVVSQLFSEIAPRYANRAGGYSRILHMDKYRLGDAGDLCLFELVEEQIKSKGKAKRTKAAVKETEEPKEEVVAEAEAVEEVSEESSESAKEENAEETENTEEAEKPEA